MIPISRCLRVTSLNSMYSERNPTLRIVIITCNTKMSLLNIYGLEK